MDLVVVSTAPGFLAVPTFCNFLGGSLELDALLLLGARRGELIARLAGTEVRPSRVPDELAAAPDVDVEADMFRIGFGASTKMGAVGGCLTLGS